MTDPQWTSGARLSPRDPNAIRDGSGLAPAPFVALFRRIADRFPDRPCVEDGDHAMTFAELRRAAFRLATELSSLAPPRAPVAGIVDNGVANAVVMLACAVSDHPYVPVDATAPPERQAAILAEAAPAVMISATGTVVDPAVASTGLPNLTFDPRPTADDTNYAPPPADLDAPFAIGFTSGSTGRPKGVCWSQRQLVDVTIAYVRENGLDETSVIVSFASASPMSMRDIYAAFITGGCVRFIDIKRLGFAAALDAWRRSAMTHMTFVPSAMRVIATLPGTAEAMASLRVLTLGGETVTRADIVALRGVMPATARLAIALGQTETGPLCHWFADVDRIGGETAPAGYFYPSRTVAIVDDDGLPVSLGGVGELIVSDAEVTLGYWRDGALAPTFVAAPGEPGPRTCRTGDLVRVRADGLVEHLGRRDGMVKIRGLRVELGEIEGALRAMDEIADAAVVVSTDPVGAAVLTAFLVQADDARPVAPTALRRHVRARTADHMVPHAFRFIPAIPRLHNEKADLILLRSMAAEPVA